VALLTGRQDMTNLQRSLKAKVKALQETQGQQANIKEVLVAMKPRLESIDQSLRNLNLALKRGDKIAAGGFLTEMGQAVKALMTLTGQ
jgi:phage-related tail protein